MKKPIIYILIIILLVLAIINRLSNNVNCPNKLFYNIKDSDDFMILTDIYKYHKNIYIEVNNLNTNPNLNVIWYNWPHTDLYIGSWKIVPLYGFGYWINTNCNMCPVLTNFLKSIPNLKSASLSKLDHNSKIKPHTGWYNVSVDSIRCHYPIITPPNCFISVSNVLDPPLYSDNSDNSDNNNILLQNYPNDFSTKYEIIKYHKNYEWIIYDDMNVHYSENMHNTLDRIILIIDILKPSCFNKKITNYNNINLADIKKYYKDNSKL